MKKNIRAIAAFVRDIPENVDETRTIEFVISDSSRDRHSTVLNTAGWDLSNYNLNPIVGYNHNVYGDSFFTPANPDDIIGKSSVFVEEGKLIGRITFEPAAINPHAEKIFQKVKFGTLRAASVGFSEIGNGKYGDGEEARGAKNETYYFEGQELYEWSIVNIPSNPTAVKRANEKQPNVGEIVEEYNKMALKFDNEELAKVSVIAFLKHFEGIELLQLIEKKNDSVVSKLKYFSNKTRLAKISE